MAKDLFKSSVKCSFAKTDNTAHLGCNHIDQRSFNYDHFYLIETLFATLRLAVGGRAVRRAGGLADGPEAIRPAEGAGQPGRVGGKAYGRSGVGRRVGTPAGGQADCLELAGE